MIVLAFGVVLFAVLHLIPAVPGLKARLKAQSGERLYGPLYGAASLAALVVIVLGWRASPFVPAYEPPAWGAHANYLFTLVAFIGLGTFLFRGRLRQVLRFPLGFGVMFWATGHLFANGDARSLILFGGMLLYALAHVGLGFANGVRPSPEVRGGHDLLGIFSGIALYGVMSQLHVIVIGVPVFPLVR